MNELSYTKKCTCESNQFCSFVNESDHFSEEDKQRLTQIIVTDGFSRILYVSGTLAIWSLIAGIIDAVLFPGIIVYAIFHGVVDYKVITPPVVFLLGNIFAKLVYISISLNGKIKIVDILISVLPYAGSAYLLKKFLINDKKMALAVSSYLKKKKQDYKYQLIAYFKRCES